MNSSDSHFGLRAIVTGGASGIGAAVARALLQRDADVVILDMQVRQVPSDSDAVVCDVTDEESVRDAVDSAVREMGGLDILVNNAGIGAQGTVLDNSESEWLRVFGVNVFGAVRVSRFCVPYLRESLNASIVNTCSVAATMGLPNRALYSASKGALAALTRAMAADHLHEGIRVNAVSPGTVDTPWVSRLLADAANPSEERRALEERQPHGRLVLVEEVAEAVAYLTSIHSRSITGTELAVDGGLTSLIRPRPRG